MNFYIYSGREGYAGYDSDNVVGEVEGAPFIVGAYRKLVASPLVEYLWEERGRQIKPRKCGDFHESCGLVFANEKALKLIEKAARGKVQAFPITIKGREDETFYQLFVLNCVNCLDVGQTDSSPPGNFWKNKIGVIRGPVFDENRWDGSDLFVVPEDPSTKWFCTENFVKEWKAAKLKGACFSKRMFDPEKILS
jgi:hypothetical protein